MYDRFAHKDRVTNHNPHGAQHRQSKARAIVREQQNMSFHKALITGIIFIAALLFANSLWAAKKDDTINKDPAVQQAAVEFITSLSDKALEVLTNPEFTEEDRLNEFRIILSEGFDIRKIGMLSLGRHRKKASKDQLSTYYELFPEFLINLYATRLDKLDIKAFDIGDVIPSGKKDMFVRSKVTGLQDKAIDVDWRVRPYPDDVYKIIDVKIEGISMARTQRDDFTSRISESGVEGLNEYMQKIIDEQGENEESELAADDQLVAEDTTAVAE